MKYKIAQKFLPKYTKRRSGRKINKVGFIVAHDTGNKNSTANGNVSYYTNSANDMSASAHIFVDDKVILECIPAFKNPEKAWHVQYQKTKDNELYGDDANDIAIGVEYCYGDNINADEAYKRYIWTIAYLCHYYDLNPATDVVGHFILDPQRKTDPENGLRYSGRSYNQLLKDIVNEYNDCLSEGDKEMKINALGKEITLNDYVFQNNMNYVNLREVFEQLNCVVDYDTETKQISVRLK